MVVWKKKGDIIYFFEFSNLNQQCLKDNYMIPNMENIFPRVRGDGMLSMLDGFYGYIQLLVKEYDQLKTRSSLPLGEHTSS